MSSLSLKGVKKDKMFQWTITISTFSYLRSVTTTLSIGLPFGVAALAAHSQYLLLLGL